MVGLPIGTEEQSVKSAVRMMKDEGPGRVARCLADTLDNQAAVLVATGSLHRGQATMGGSWIRVFPS